MAGNYPDPPAPRMAYDRDGTIAFRILGGNPIQSYGPNTGSIIALNNETDDLLSLEDGSGSPVYAGLVFPQPRDIRGIYINYYQVSSATLYSSTDTTNGVDGTWSTVAGVSLVDNNVIQSYRSSIGSVTLNGITGLRIRRDNGYGGAIGPRAIHIYGSYAAGTTPDRLRIWHPTLDEPLDDPDATDGVYFDWGNVPRSSSQDRTFRIKNDSATMTATGISITQQALTDTTPSVPAQFTFSDGGAFSTTISISDLAPGALSPIITKRFAPPSNATLSLWASRTVVTPTSWS